MQCCKLQISDNYSLHLVADILVCLPSQHHGGNKAECPALSQLSTGGRGGGGGARVGPIKMYLFSPYLLPPLLSSLSLPLPHPISLSPTLHSIPSPLYASSSPSPFPPSPSPPPLHTLHLQFSHSVASPYKIESTQVDWVVLIEVFQNTMHFS